MFYSHQLLARKAPLGQIWMAATMHAKINRRKLDKLNIIKICEEILNPSVPMALRLSGILMGGVVIVYERKVKLLYDDVTHLLVELNEAWKVKAVADPTVLPKGKSQAKKEAVTLPENEETDVGEIEHLLNFPHTTTTMQFQQNAYFEMRLDSVDEPYTDSNAMKEDHPKQFHQADVEDITLTERFDSDQADTNRFERFDIEGDEETLLNFSQIPNTLIPSPSPQDESPKAYQPPEPQVNQPSAECKEFGQAQGRQGPKRRRIRRKQSPVIDCEQTIIHGHVYQSWLQDASDIVSRSGRKRQYKNRMSTMKIANLMELPPLVLIDDLFTPGNKEIYYPPPLLDLWMKSTQPPHDSPSELTSPPLPPEPSSSSPPERRHYQESVGYPFEDFHSGAGSPSLRASIERQRTNFPNSDIPPDFMMEQLGANLMNNGMGGIDSNLMVTPANSDGVRSIPSSGSGQGVPSHGSVVNSGRSNKKRPHSSSRLNSGGLEPVSEENTWSQPDPDFMLSRLSENGLTPEQELLVETGPTQTQKPIITDPLDKITDAIRMQMKAHFDTAGTPQVESLNKLAAGMNRKGAAMFFYRTCVLATRGFLQVEQKVPYGEILISRGARM